MLKGGRLKRKARCIRTIPNRVKMVVGLYVGLLDVEGIMENVLIGKFMGKFIKEETFKS